MYTKYIAYLFIVFPLVVNAADQKREAAKKAINDIADIILEEQGCWRYWPFTSMGLNSHECKQILRARELTKDLIDFAPESGVEQSPRDFNRLIRNMMR